jgi:mannose-6-phosphate isomerase-like protein (cupin superfamily)
MKERIRIRFDIEQESIDNKNYRKVIFTGDHLQVVLMSLKPNEMIGLEIHPHTDQFFRIEKGRALFLLSSTEESRPTEHVLVNGDALVVPAGTWHNIKNDSARAYLKLYTIYAPPKHPAGTIERSKPVE